MSVIKRSELLLALVISLCVTSSHAASPAGFAEGKIIVKGKAGLPDAQLEKILGKAQGRSVSKLQQINAHIVEVPPKAEDAVIKALSNNPHIDYAEKDMLVELSAITPDDPGYSRQWHLPKIQGPAAWDIATGSGVIIAILDTGVESSHPDLAGKLVPGWNTASDNGDTSPVMWHGTSVAGVAAATSNNALGVSSIAWDASIMPVRVTNRSDGVAEWSALAAGILWAADQGADVVNISYDIAVGSFLLNDAAQYLRSKGGLLVHAAGNSNVDGGFSDNPYMITVSATTSSDTRASFSNYGNNIDVAAPGSGIYTTYQNGGYANTSGTSFASPATAGVIALIMAANPALTTDEIEAVLEDSAVDLGASGWDPEFGHGRVDAGAAVQMVGGTTPGDNQAPGVTILSPGTSQTVSGTVLVDVDAWDDTGVTEVAVHVNGQVIGTDRTTPYQFSWDSAGVADGLATLTAYAYDSAGNAGISPGVTVQVENQADSVDAAPPVVTIIEPADGSTVSGRVRIRVAASDDVGVTELSVYIDGGLLCSGVDTGTLNCNWNTRKVDAGSHTIRTLAKDASGKSAETSITVSTSGSTRKSR